MIPNKGIFQDGREAAFIHGAPPTDHPYNLPGMQYQRWSWMAGYVDGLRMRIELEAISSKSSGTPSTRGPQLEPDF